MSRLRVGRPHPGLLALIASASLTCPPAARAIDLDAKVEPGVAVPLGAPQSQRFSPGGAGTFKLLVGPEGSYLDLSAGLTFVGLPAQAGYPSSSPGTAWAPGVGLRLQRPLEVDEARRAGGGGREPFFGARPWLDADGLYVRTGGLDRPGFAAAAGVSFPLGGSGGFWLGPFVRYFQVLQDNQAGGDDRDSKTLILGLSLEIGARFTPAPPLPAPATWVETPSPPAVKEAAPPAAPPADRDGDGVPDDQDACPDAAGPASNGGCPIYEKVIVKPDRLELKEKIQFGWNTAEIDPASLPLLDEVAQALRDNKGFRVAIGGNSSSEGGEEHNQALSDRRALAVLEYLAHRGIARDRLSSQGFSSSRPLESNDTESGREANRRVEFVVHFVILKEKAQ